MNSYELSRLWFDWCFENPEKINPNHSALYFFIIEHCNRLGWKEKFGLPMQMAKDAIGISNYRTYSKTFEDLVSWGFIIVYQKSKNQYSANIVGIAQNTIATTKALDIAMQKHSQKQVHGIVGIDKPNNIEHITLNNIFNFKDSLIDFGFEKKLVDDWLKVRKTKKATNTETAFRKFIEQVKMSNEPVNEILELCIEKSWSGFKSEWLDNLKNEKEKSSAKKEIQVSGDLIHTN
jgi:hypothetical protein